MFDLEKIKHVEVAPAEVRCGDLKKFKKYLQEQGILKDNKPFARLYGVDVYEDKNMPANHVAGFVNGQLVSLIEITSGTTS